MKSTQSPLLVVVYDSRHRTIILPSCLILERSRRQAHGRQVMYGARTESSTMRAKIWGTYWSEDTHSDTLKMLRRIKMAGARMASLPNWYEKLPVYPKCSKIGNRDIENKANRIMAKRREVSPESSKHHLQQLRQEVQASPTFNFQRHLRIRWRNSWSICSERGNPSPPSYNW